MIQIIFEANTRHGVFRDALYLPDDHILTEAEIDAMKQQRVDNWLTIVEAPPIEEPPADA